MPQQPAPSATPAQPPARDPEGFDIADDVDDPRIIEPEDLPKESSRKQIDFNGPAYQGLPPALLDLMKVNLIPEEYVRKAVASKGYFPEDMPIAQYPRDFIDGVLIGAWSQVVQTIDDLMLPF